VGLIVRGDASAAVYRPLIYCSEFRLKGIERSGRMRTSGWRGSLLRPSGTSARTIGGSLRATKREVPGAFRYDGRLEPFIPMKGIPMAKYARTLLAVVGATVMLSALVSSASAGRLSTTSRNVRATWSSMEFVEPVFGASVRCPVTLEGSFHSATMAKVVEALVGFISRGTINNSLCAGGRGTILQASLPWHIRYVGFQGTLPNITVLRTVALGMGFRVDGAFGSCLFLTTVLQPSTGSLNRSVVTRSLTSVDAGGEITSSEACGPFGSRVTGRLSGRSTSLTVLGAATAITITLI
jgi:hypothetical protein